MFFSIFVIKKALYVSLIKINAFSIIKCVHKRGEHMVDKICDTLLNKIRKADLSIDDEKAEIIYYGLQNMIGELPKVIIIFCVAALIGIFKLVVIGTIVLMVYRGLAGGIHLKSHISCLLVSMTMMYGSIYLAREIVFDNTYLVYTILCLIDTFLAFLYAPADTENRPIIKEEQRRRQKIESILIGKFMLQ